jgi:hypothetical protein
MIFKGKLLLIVLSSFHVKHHQKDIRRVLNSILLKLMKGETDLRRALHKGYLAFADLDKAHFKSNFPNY